MDHKVTEHFISLSLNPATGRYLVPGNFLSYGITGAMLMDLALAGKTGIKDHNLILTRDSSPAGIVPYDRMIRKISAAGRKKTVKKWLQVFNRRSSLYRREMQKYLEAQGILRTEKKMFIGIPYKLNYLRKAELKNELITRYRDIILHDKPPADHEIMMMGLLFACKMHKILSGPGPERRQIRKKLVEINNNGPYSSLTDRSVTEMQKALTFSVAGLAGMSSSPAV